MGRFLGLSLIEVWFVVGFSMNFGYFWMFIVCLGLLGVGFILVVVTCITWIK